MNAGASVCDGSFGKDGFGVGDLGNGVQRGEDATAQPGSSASSAPINASSSSGRASNKRALEAQHASKLDELTALRAKAKRLGDSRGMQGERRAIKLERAADTLEQQVRGRLASPDMHDARAGPGQKLMAERAWLARPLEGSCA